MTPRWAWGIAFASSRSSAPTLHPRRLEFVEQIRNLCILLAVYLQVHIRMQMRNGRKSITTVQVRVVGVVVLHICLTACTCRLLNAWRGFRCGVCLRRSNQGLDDDLDLKRILRAWKKNFNCNGAHLIDKEKGEIIQLQGDQRANVRDFLVDQEICRAERIVVHGFGI